MKYQVIVLDLDGTLTNSKKEITPPTRDALIEIQQNGKKVVLASGRPINGVAPLAEELYLKEYGGFMLSFNGARITRCSDNAIIYNKVIPQEAIRPIYEAVKEYPGLDLISYTDKVILSGIKVMNTLRKKPPSTAWRSVRLRTSLPHLISRSIKCLSQVNLPSWKT